MEHPCKTFDRNEFAFTVRCACHTEVQLGFGNIALLLSVRDFLHLKKQIAHTQNQMRDVPCKCRKNIVVDTSVKNMAFMFTYHELTLLHEVMQNTVLMLEVEGILKN